MNKSETESACIEQYYELAECLIKTKCFRDGGTLKECLKNDEVTDECQTIRKAFRLCKMSRVDPRRRMRGAPTS